MLLFMFSFLSSCDKEEPETSPDPIHLSLDQILDHLPFDQFNAYSKAIFRDSLGSEVEFFLSIREDIKEDISRDTLYSFNEIRLIYGLEFDIGLLPIIMRATFTKSTSEGLREIIKCNLSKSSSFSNPELEIIPETEFKNTILIEEFDWMGESFTNVYGNNCLLNAEGIHKIYFQSTVGIIALTDNTGKCWILDRFE